MKGVVNIHDFQLSGLHEGPLHSPSSCHTPEPTLLLRNEERRFLPAAFIAIECAIRLLGKSLYNSGIPHYIVNSASPAGNACDRCTLIEVVVPDAGQAFDCLKSAGMKADPMRSLSVMDRAGKVSIRLLQSGIAWHSFQPGLRLAD